TVIGAAGARSACGRRRGLTTTVRAAGASAAARGRAVARAGVRTYRPAAELAAAACAPLISCCPAWRCVCTLARVAPHSTVIAGVDRVTQEAQLCVAHGDIEIVVNIVVNPVIEQVVELVLVDVAAHAEYVADLQRVQAGIVVQLQVEAMYTHA